MVGLPCQIQSLRKYTSLFKNVGKLIIGYFAIYCSSNRTMRSQEFLLYRYGVKEKTLPISHIETMGVLAVWFLKIKMENVEVCSLPDVLDWYERFLQCPTL